MMLGCNRKLVSQVFLFANASQSTRKSAHGTRHCGVCIYVAQGLHIAIVLGICGLERTSEHIYFLSHDIRRVLYLVLLYGDMPLILSI